MAKSTGNFLKLQSLIEKNINPVAYRFWLLMANYGTKVNFVWEALEGAENALKRLFGFYKRLGKKTGTVNEEYRKKFQEFIEDDLDTPRALSLLWDLVKDDKISDPDKKATILDFDKIFGLGFEKLKEEKIPQNIKKLGEEREQARKNKDFKKSDELRKKLFSLGYKIDDAENGYKINRI